MYLKSSINLTLENLAFQNILKSIVCFSETNRFVKFNMSQSFIKILKLVCMFGKIVKACLNCVKSTYINPIQEQYVEV